MSGLLYLLGQPFTIAMEFLQTPDDRFQQLPDFPFAPHYLPIDAGLQMHYIDEGPPSAQPILLLHGEPSWSFLYRKMIPTLVQADFRVIAPDLIGFGKSDKPAQMSDYTFARHLRWLTTFFEKLDLHQVVLFCQDWGGLLGLRLAVDQEDRFDCIIAANTFLPTGDGTPNETFTNWLTFSREVPKFPVGQILQHSTVNELSPEVIAAYDAPFPSEEFKAGARIFPSLVPISPDDPEAQPNKMAWQKLRNWQKPFLTLFSDKDPIMFGYEKIFQKVIPGAQGQPHEIIENAGHFLQEDKGELIAEKVVSFLNKT